MLFIVNNLVTNNDAHSEYGLSIKENLTCNKYTLSYPLRTFCEFFSLAVSLYLLPWCPVKQLDVSSDKNINKNS